jgi:hypothetical protein
VLVYGSDPVVVILIGIPPAGDARLEVSLDSVAKLAPLIHQAKRSNGFGTTFVVGSPRKLFMLAASRYINNPLVTIFGPLL